MTIYLAPGVALLGLLFFFFAGERVRGLVRVGEIMFFAGLLATLLLFGSASSVSVTGRAERSGRAP